MDTNSHALWKERDFFVSTSFTSATVNTRFITCLRTIYCKHTPHLKCHQLRQGASQRSARWVSLTRPARAAREFQVHALTFKGKALPANKHVWRRREMQVRACGNPAQVWSLINYWEGGVGEKGEEQRHKRQMDFCSGVASKAAVWLRNLN